MVDHSIYIGALGIDASSLPPSYINNFFIKKSLEETNKIK